MAQETKQNGHGTNGNQVNGHQNSTRGSLYERAVLGFRNYWYPVCLTKEVTEKKPKAMTLLGDEVVLLRRGGKAYALADECAHRGTRLSRGKHEFPGTNTITCRYHGWVYDVTNGVCIAALPDGPESPIIGKAAVRTYPVEERQGMVWVWMGKIAPVPVEEDIPPLLLREGTVTKIIVRMAYGNWRWHAENVGAGHAAVLHRDSVHSFFRQMYASVSGIAPAIEVEGEDGEWLLDRMTERPKTYDEYPGLGRWPHPRPWRRVRSPEPVMFGVKTKVSIRLPSITRVPNFPIRRAVYYEWYTPVDEDHYIYFQVSAAWPKGPIARISHFLRYYLWGRPTGMVRFNSQDVSMVGDSTDYEKRHGGNWPTALFRPDLFQLAWRRMCNERARGEAVEPPRPEREAVASGAGSGSDSQA